MRMLTLLVAALAVCCNATIYVKDENYEEDYADLDHDENNVAQADEEEKIMDYATVTEESGNEVKTWQDFSKDQELSFSVDMKEIERYYVRFPCSESANRIQFTLHLEGENEKNSYIAFTSRNSGQIFCNKAKSQKFRGGAYKKFNIPDSISWQCDEDGKFMILEVERTSDYLAFKNRKNIIYHIRYNKPFGSKGECGKETKRVVVNMGKSTRTLQKGKYKGPLSFAFSTATTGLRDFGSKIDRLKQEIQLKFAEKSPLEIKSYVKSTEGALKVFQWWLMTNVYDKKRVLNLDEETLGWMLTNREALEMFMTSGDVKDDKYWEALMIFRELILQDPDIKNDPLRLRLAVATSLTHSTPVKSFAVGRNNIDWVKTYQSYLKWSQEGVLYPQFFRGTAWHLRYVVGTWQTVEDQIWAREMFSLREKNPTDLGKGLKMVKYRGNNTDDLRVGNSKNYYYYQPVTLKVIHEIGGVCGAISKFNAGMCQAFGVPASPVGQPGHCAWIWWTEEGQWVRRNSLRNWGETRSHSGIQYTWGRPAYFIPLMNEAQNNLLGYRLSEKMRIASMLANPEDRFEILEIATTECPYNFAAWMELEGAIREGSLQKSAVQDVLLPVVLAQRERDKEVSDVAAEKTVSSEFFGNTSSMITDPTTNVGCCINETGSFEIDLDGSFSIKAVKFKHINKSKPKKYDIFAMSEDGTYALVKTERDAQRTEDWWTHIDGWKMITTKIKVDLKKGALSKYRKKQIYYGIVHFQVYGLPLDKLDDVSKGKPIAANPDSTDPLSLVDDNDSTSWEGNNEYSWFEIDLKRICALDDIEIFWVDDTRPESVRISHKVGSSQEIGTPARAPFVKMPLQMQCGTTIKVEMSGGNPVLKGVKACGTAYSAKDILKMKLYNSLRDFYYVRQHVKDSIERMEYED